MPTNIVRFLMVLLTIGYCWAIWYASMLFSIVVPYENGSYNTSMISIILIAPFPGAGFWGAIHWQTAALASLILNLWWGFKRSKTDSKDNANTLPLACHTTWVVSSICFHAVGFLASFVYITNIL